MTAPHPVKLDVKAEVLRLLKAGQYVPPSPMERDYLKPSSYEWSGDRPPGYFIQTYVGVDRTIDAILDLVSRGRAEEDEDKEMLLNFLIEEHKASECFCVGERTDICEWCVSESCLKAYRASKAKGGA